MSDLYRKMSIHESECKLLCNKIKSLNLRLSEKRRCLEKLKNEKTPFTPNQPRADSASNISPYPSLSPCNNSEKPHETDSSAISPVRKVPRFMSPTASSRGKKSPGVLGDHTTITTQQPPMTFTSGYSKRVFAAPRGVLTDSLRLRAKGDTRNVDITTSKRKLLERSPWPATAKKPDSADTSVCTTTSIDGPTIDKTKEILSPTPTKFTELPANVMTPVSHSKASEEHYSRILAAERSISKLAVSVSSAARGSSPRSRRRLSMDCGSMNGTMKRFVF